MKFTPQSIPDVVMISPTIHSDNRGYFAETYRQNLLDAFIGYKVNFVQDNESKSSKGVLRGLHYQIPPLAQSKLVRVIEGSVLDVAVDIRKSSPTFGQYVAIELSSDNKRQLFIPRGFAHGFLVLSKSAVFSYKVDNFYSPDHERGVIYNDNQLAIDWLMNSNELKLSVKDLSYSPLSLNDDLFD